MVCEGQGEAGQRHSEDERQHLLPEGESCIWHKILFWSLTFCIPAEYNGQKSKNGAESCLRDDEAEARAAQGIFCTTNTLLGPN